MAEHRDTDALETDATQWDHWADKLAKIAVSLGGAGYYALAGHPADGKWDIVRNYDDLGTAARAADWSTFQHADEVKEAYIGFIDAVASSYYDGNLVLEAVARRLLSVARVALEAEGASTDEVDRIRDNLPWDDSAGW